MTTLPLPLDSCQVRGGLTSFHFHDFVKVETEWVETFMDTNVLSNIVTPLPRGHRDGDVEEFGHACVTKCALNVFRRIRIL